MRKILTNLYKHQSTIRHLVMQYCQYLFSLIQLYEYSSFNIRNCRKAKLYRKLNTDLGNIGDICLYKKVNEKKGKKKEGKNCFLFSFPIHTIPGIGFVRMTLGR